MLKAFIFAGALAVLLPAATQAQPRYYYDQGYYQGDRGYYRGDRDDDDRRLPRYWDRGYGYGYPGVPYVKGHPAYDEYGPDPNGTRAPDGHRIKCKLVDEWDGYYGQYIRRRNCW